MALVCACKGLDACCIKTPSGFSCRACTHMVDERLMGEKGGAQVS